MRRNPPYFICAGHAEHFCAVFFSFGGVRILSALLPGSNVEIVYKLPQVGVRTLYPPIDIVFRRRNAVAQRPELVEDILYAGLIRVLRQIFFSAFEEHVYENRHFGAFLSEPEQIRYRLHAAEIGRHDVHLAVASDYPGDRPAPEVFDYAGDVFFAGLVLLRKLLYFSRVLASGTVE